MPFALGQGQAQLQAHLAPQQRRDPLALAEAQAPLVGGIADQQARGHQLAKQAAPLAPVQLLADAIDAQVLVAQGPDFFAVGPQQHVHQMGGAKAAAGAIHRREGLAGRFGHVLAAVGFEADIAVAAGLLEGFAEVAEQHLAATGRGFGEADQGIELAVFDRLLARFGAGVFDEAAQLGHIAGPMHHPGDGGQAIAAAPARFLVIGLQALGQIHVGHKAHIRLVDAHAKGDRGHHDHAAVTAEALQHGRAPLGIEAGVIGQGVKAGGGQLLGQAVDPLARAGVDDAGFALAGRQERLQLGPRPLLLAHQVGDVGPIEAGQEHPVVLQAQALTNIFAGAAIGGGGEGQAGNGWEPIRQHGQLQVLGPEIVAPLGDAMGLVNGEQGNRQFGQAIEAVARQ